VFQSLVWDDECLGTIQHPGDDSILQFQSLVWDDECLGAA